MNDKTTQRIKALIPLDLTLEAMCRTLNSEGHQTPEGHDWTPIVLLVKVQQLRHDLTPQPVSASVQLTRMVIA